jgi:hypothetical protein
MLLRLPNLHLEANIPVDLRFDCIGMQNIDLIEFLDRLTSDHLDIDVLYSDCRSVWIGLPGQ